VLVLSASLRATVRVFIGKHFFSYRYDYREEWLAFTAMLASNPARKTWACMSCARWPTSSNALPARCGPGRPPTGLRAGGLLEPAQRSESQPADSSLHPVSCAASPG
jgi:hypothetical protein